MTALTKGTNVIFNLDIARVGKFSGVGEVVDEGRFAILGETYTIRVTEDGNYAAGTYIEAKRSSLRIAA